MPTRISDVPPSATCPATWWYQHNLAAASLPPATDSIGNLLPEVHLLELETMAGRRLAVRLHSDDLQALAAAIGLYLASPQEPTPVF